MEEPLLRIENLHASFFTERGVARSVRGVDLTIERGKTVGLVGESGCGKSVTAQAVMRLLPEPIGRITEGNIRFDGHDLRRLPEREMRRIRGDRMAMIFQEPMSSLNPVIPIGEQIAETLRLHRGRSRREAMDEAKDILGRVRISEPSRRIRQYPHELSGGMRQRVMIAMALACDPALIIADEPTTALDVTIQAQILDLIDELQSAVGAAVLLITHDFGVVAETADRVAVMYAGEIVEEASVDDLFASPLHPYTIALMRAVPQMDQPISADRMLPAIPGLVPSPMEWPAGCAFAARCAHAHVRCAQPPPNAVATGGHNVRCWLHVPRT